MKHTYKIDDVLTRGVAEILPSREGLADLIAKKKITLYQGFDPSTAELHIGHLIGIRKLAQFQKLGHKVIFLIGDFTGMIGDPSGKTTARKSLTRDVVLKNTKGWKEQISKIIDFTGPNAAELKFNSTWLEKLTFADVIALAGKFTVQQMLERDMFQERLKEKKSIFLHEFMYPLMQGYDSVAMNVDLEIGGTDQLFNMLAGRTLMKLLRGKEKFVLTTKLLVGSSGKKMSKSEGTTVNLADSPETIFGGIMALPDDMIVSSAELLTDLPLQTTKELLPMEAKKLVATEIVNQIYGDEKVRRARKFFEKTFQERKPSFDIKVSAGETLVKTVTPFTQRQSISAAKELIKQRAVDVNGAVETDVNLRIKVGDEIKVGERIFLKATK